MLQNSPFAPEVNTLVYGGLCTTGSTALVADCGRIFFQTVKWLLRKANLAEGASHAINTTQY
jgi:hypothetical protein